MDHSDRWSIWLTFSFRIGKGHRPGAFVALFVTNAPLEKVDGHANEVVVHI